MAVKFEIAGETSMQAFGAGASSDFLYIAHWKCQWYLPKIECDACGETQWSTDVWYPSCELASKAEISKFSDEVTVTANEFEVLARQVKSKGPKGTRLQAAAGLGPVHARLSKRKSDFFWCGGKPLVSLRGSEALATEGFQITTGPVFDIQTGAATEYLAWEVPVVPLYTERILKQLTLVQCPKCKAWSLENLRTKLSGPREYVAERVPEATGLVRPEEGGETLATGRFMDVVRSKKLRGIEFREWGAYV